MSREEVYNKTMDSFKSDLALHNHTFQQAEIYGDIDGQVEALRQIARVKRDMQDTHDIAVQDARGMQAAQQAAPKANKYGLTREERAAALLITSDHRGLKPLSNDDKFAAYAVGKAKYQRFLQTGTTEGDDDEG